MAKRLTAKEKKEIIKSFTEGNSLDFLSKNFNCTKLTIVRNLKKELGEKEYKELNNAIKPKKENITILKNSLDKICNIRGVKYNWKNDEDKKITAGVIAQEVLEKIPEDISHSNKDKLSVNYNAIIAYLIESIKELTREKNVQQNDIMSLKDKIEEQGRIIEKIMNKLNE